MTGQAPQRPQAFVVGGARRVGRAIVLALARAGCDVGLSYNTSVKQAEQTASDARELGAECSIWRLPLDHPTAARTGADEIANFRNWDVLVICASSYEQTPFEQLTAEQLTASFAVNASTPALLIQNFLGSLRGSSLPGGGCIVTMCDIHAMGPAGRPRKSYLAYSMSKAALLEMTLVLARELAPKVRVNAVAPGVVAWPDSGPNADPVEQAKYLARIPLARSGTPEEAAEAVRWLALEARYCTGQVIRVDGGRSLT